MGWQTISSGQTAASSPAAVAVRHVAPSSSEVQRRALPAFPAAERPAAHTRRPAPQVMKFGQPASALGALHFGTSAVALLETRNGLPAEVPSVPATTRRPSPGLTATAAPDTGVARPIAVQLLPPSSVR